MINPGDGFEEIWGPPPTAEKLTEIHEWSDRMGRERIARVLEQCINHTHAMHKLGIDEVEELITRIEQREFVALQTGSEYWFPQWQFAEDMTVEPTVKRAYEAWGELDVWGFCEMAIMVDEAYGKTRLQMIEDNHPEEVRQALYTLETHGVNYYT